MHIEVVLIICHKGVGYDHSFYFFISYLSDGQFGCE